MILAYGGYTPNDCIKIFTTARLAKKPITATETKRINCLDDLLRDSWNTKNLVIRKLTTTPIKNEIAKDKVELRTVYDSN